VRAAARHAPETGSGRTGSARGPQARAAPAPARVEPTLDGVPAVDPPAPAGPATRAPGGRATVHRLARRHEIEDETPPEATERSRLGPAIAAVALATILAAVIGVVVGSAGGTRTPAPKTASTLSPAKQAAQVVGVLSGVASSRRAGLARLDAARTAAAQASAATAVAKAYAGGARRLETLPAVTRSAAPTQAIDGTLKRLAHDYTSLSADASALRKLRYAHELGVIVRDEQTLRTHTHALV
jgi:hypothetical protein